MNNSFKTTVKYLVDILEHMDDDVESESESNARELLIGLCVDIALDYGHDIDRPVVEAD